MRILGWTFLVIVLLAVGGHFALNFLFFGRLTAPTTADFAAIARQNQYVVQAIYDFKADHGMLPQSLADLVPKYLPTMPGVMVMYDGDSLDIPAHAPHTGVYYSFRADQEGWFVGGDFGNGPLPVPKPASTHPPLAGNELIKTRIAEYDRRIAADPKSRRNYVE